MPLFEHPQLELEDRAVLDAIHRDHAELGMHLRTPRRWSASLRRNAVARAIRGSNSIEGYHVDFNDAVAAVEDEEPMSTDAATWAEIRGYRLALGYVLTSATDTTAQMNEEILRALHYMMLNHDLSKSPGRYREREIFVQDEETDQIVYVAPDAPAIPALMGEFVNGLTSRSDPFRSRFVTQTPNAVDSRIELSLRARRRACEPCQWCSRASSWGVPRAMG